MVVGHLDDFAIEWEIVESVDTWLLGHIRFWVQGQELGDWDDLADLKGCRNWLYSFAHTPQNRFEEALGPLHKEAIFSLLFDSVMPVIAGSATSAYPPFPNVETRFHISYLGMSSFDHFDILLLESSEWQRILWRNAHDVIVKEAYLLPQTIQKMVKQFCLEFPSAAFTK